MEAPLKYRTSQLLSACGSISSTIIFRLDSKHTRKTNKHRRNQLNTSIETRKHEGYAKLLSKIMDFAVAAKQMVHTVLLITFIGVASSLIVSFIIECHAAFAQKTNLSASILHAFGTLLVVWTVAELINAEIAVMKGHHFGVTVLIDVALAASVRKILISDFHFDKDLMVALVSLGCLTFVRRIISTSEKKD